MQTHTSQTINIPNDVSWSNKRVCQVLVYHVGCVVDWLSDRETGCKDNWDKVSCVTVEATAIVKLWHVCRQLSGAQIKISDPMQGVPHREVTIAGSPDRVQLAQYLINNRYVSCLTHSVWTKQGTHLAYLCLVSVEYIRKSMRLLLALLLVPLLCLLCSLPRHCEREFGLL